MLIPSLAVRERTCSCVSAMMIVVKLPGRLSRPLIRSYRFVRPGKCERIGSTREYIRELPWSSRSPAMKKTWADEAECRACYKGRIVEDELSLKHPEKIGIVGAMSRNRVIGVGGILPWSIPEDRAYFEGLTKGKVLIIGRNTYEDGTHISHVRRCILVSQSANPADYSKDGTLIARSFSEALSIAKELEDSNCDVENRIDCWVGGGQRLYEEALNHAGAFQVHLTTVRTDINVAKIEGIALFPAKYRWDNHFRVQNKWEGKESGSVASSGLKYSFTVYQRILSSNT